MLDYSSINFLYGIPKGIDVTLYDKGKTTHVTSNYAVSYKFTNIIDKEKWRLFRRMARH
jgi:hypothetical protein